MIHGLEDPGEAPYAQIERLRVHVSVRNLFSPHVRLRSLEIDRPSLHLIVYPDGSTNQPHPRKPRRSRESALDTLFDMRAGHIAVEQGMLHFDNRAASFDYQDRYAPLDFEANDVSVLLRYLPAARGTPETYRIEAGATDLNLSRAVPRGKSTPVHGTLQATIDLERARLLLRSLRLTAHSAETKDRTLEVSGDVEDFTHPRWQARAVGDLDMRLLDPITGYPDAPEGIAHLDLAAGGQADDISHRRPHSYRWGLIHRRGRHRDGHHPRRAGPCRCQAVADRADRCALAPGRANRRHGRSPAVASVLFCRNRAAVCCGSRGRSG